MSNNKTTSTSNNEQPKNDSTEKKSSVEKETLPEKEIKKTNASLVKIIVRYQFLIVLAIIVFGLGFAILSITNLFNVAMDISDYDEGSTIITFDKNTIKQIEDLNNSANQPPVINGDNRNNPFLSNK